METEKSIAVLNSLVEINNDRMEGYKTAESETKESDLSALFQKMIHTSENCKNELSIEILRLKGTPTNETKISGKFFRVWMDVKVALGKNDRKTILNSCEYGEDVALKVYRSVLLDRSDELTPTQRKIISLQLSLLKKDHDYVKNLRDKELEKENN